MNLSANTQLCNISHICVFIYNNSEANFSGQNCSQLVIYVFYVSFLCLTISFSLSRLAYNMSIVDKKSRFLLSVPQIWFFVLARSMQSQ